MVAAKSSPFVGTCLCHSPVAKIQTLEYKLDYGDVCSFLLMKRGYVYNKENLEVHKINCNEYGCGLEKTVRNVQS